MKNERYVAKNLGKKEFSIEEKNKIRNEWCDQLCFIFDTYNKSGEKEKIRTPLYTSRVLSKLGLIPYEDIKQSEKPINISFGKTQSTENENLIFKCFDKLIEKKELLENKITEFRNHFKHDEMPNYYTV